MRSTKKEIRSGDIFIIPLFLPAFQEWRDLECVIDYRKYKFHESDICAFGRLIEEQNGKLYLVEIFSYVGKIPESPEVIIHSGRLFEPVFVVGVFSRDRWRFLYDDPHYDKWIDSDYKNISFLLHTRLWKGGEQIKITYEQSEQFIQSGILGMVIHDGPNLERDIRALLSERGVELNYEQTVEERRNEYPKPRDLDRKLKETISPFRWLSGSGIYSLSLDAGLINQESFAKYTMPGNGYDWEKAASAFIEIYRKESGGKFTFDCEADTFSMQSSSKKALKEFSLAFHTLTLDTGAFEELLSQL